MKLDMRVIVIGGSGATGKFLINNLLATDWVSEVVVLLRKEALGEHPKLNKIVVDFDRLEEYADVIKGDVAFSCMGTTLKKAGSKEAQWRVDYDYQYNFAKIARDNGVSTFVLLSAKNANEQSAFFYGKMKGRLEKSVTDLDFDKLIIVQPGFLIRPGTDRISEKLGVSIVKTFNKLGLLKEYRPTHVNVVSLAMIRSVNAFEGKVKKVSVGDIEHLAKQSNAAE